MKCTLNLDKVHTKAQNVPKSARQRIWCALFLKKGVPMHSKVHRSRAGPGRAGPGRAQPRPQLQGAAPGAEERCANAFKSVQIPDRPGPA
jgi:hypothetical protein